MQHPRRRSGCRRKRRWNPSGRVWEAERGRRNSIAGDRKPKERGAYVSASLSSGRAILLPFHRAIEPSLDKTSNQSFGSSHKGSGPSPDRSSHVIAPHGTWGACRAKRLGRKVRLLYTHERAGEIEPIRVSVGILRRGRGERAVSRAFRPEVGTLCPLSLEAWQPAPPIQGRSPTASKDRMRSYRRNSGCRVVGLSAPLYALVFRRGMS